MNRRAFLNSIGSALASIALTTRLARSELLVVDEVILTDELSEERPDLIYGSSK